MDKYLSPNFLSKKSNISEKYFILLLSNTPYILTGIIPFE